MREFDLSLFEKWVKHFYLIYILSKASTETIWTIWTADQSVRMITMGFINWGRVAKCSTIFAKHCVLQGI